MDDVDPVLDAARKGDAAALGQLWQRYSGQVSGYLRVRGVREVDDVTSEVFIGVFKGITRFVGDAAAFRTWLFTIAHHRSVDALRRDARSPDTQPYDATSDDRKVPSAEDCTLQSLDEQRARALLDVLTVEQREVIVLRFITDLGVGECAAVLGRSADAVKKLQRRAIARLHHHIAGTEPLTARPVPVPSRRTITEAT